MSDSNGKRLLSTGELAQECNVTVRGDDGRAEQPIVEAEPQSRLLLTPDTETGMSKIFAEPGTRLYETQRTMLLKGIVVDIVEVGCIAAGVVRKNWWPLVAATPLMVIITAEFVRVYHRDARYVCPHCHAVFQPNMRDFFFSDHTPKTRKLSCVNCGTKDWCAEVPAEQGVDA